VALRNPHIEDASYQHPAYYDRSAVRLVVYLFRRTEDRKNASRESGWETVPKERRYGDARAFIKAANARTRELREDAERRGKQLRKNKARWCTSFVNVVLSPANREDLSDEDFGALLGPWVRGADGDELPHVAALHRERGGRVHLHVGIVRDKFSREELKLLKKETDALAMELERGLEMEGVEIGEELSVGLELS
jgi:hypothetical protein